MITAERLGKSYGTIRALEEVSFEISKGQVVGFVGPNGAGKTTTLRILTTYLPSTSGRAVVAGFDVATQPLEVRKRLGYLPEHAPLYLEMDVEGYLDYAARVRELGARVERRKKIAAAADLCDIIDVAGRRIGELSKGYRQRVGLAQALLHDPQVLILDEPTSGLDPVQDREVRRVIRGLGRERTVIFSSHILPEVETTCDRAIVIDRGRIVADDTPDALRAKAGSRVRARVAASREKVIEGLRTALGPDGPRPDVEAKGDRALVTVAAPPDRFDAVVRALAAAGAVESLSEERGSLEDAFFKLVAKEKVER